MRRSGFAFHPRAGLLLDIMHVHRREISRVSLRNSASWIQFDHRKVLILRARRKSGLCDEVNGDVYERFEVVFRAGEEAGGRRAAYGEVAKALQTLKNRIKAEETSRNFVGYRTVGPLRRPRGVGRAGDDAFVKICDRRQCN
jgi:hypothetical protein